MTGHPHPAPLTRLQHELLAALEGGLPLVERPYAALAGRLGRSEQWVIETLRELLALGVIKRLGVVVRHRALGYRANAMVVWDLPDERVMEFGRRLGDDPAVRLCYRRPRRLPEWRYNLFTMIHGRDRAAVLRQLDGLVARYDLGGYAHRALFSSRCFKQRGARYTAAPWPAAGGREPKERDDA